MNTSRFSEPGFCSGLQHLQLHSHINKHVQKKVKGTTTPPHPPHPPRARGANLVPDRWSRFCSGFCCSNISVSLQDSGSGTKRSGRGRQRCGRLKINDFILRYKDRKMQKKQVADIKTEWRCWQAEGHVKADLHVHLEARRAPEEQAGTRTRAHLQACRWYRNRTT